MFLLYDFEHSLASSARAIQKAVNHFRACCISVVWLGRIMCGGPNWHVTVNKVGRLWISWRVIFILCARLAALFT